MRCDAYSGPDRGAGDTIHRVASAVGIKPCQGCRERRAAMNEGLPYARKAYQQRLADGDEGIAKDR
jgi:hypothetical protein